jgi:hypothetical protein
MPELRLEGRLKALCLDPRGERETALDRDLARIRDCQRQNWSPILLTWFTDHTSEGHSRRIVDLLGRAIGEQDLLTRNELFVLLAACYLHDLGMQDGKIDGRGLETMDSSWWQTVRERHPKRSRQLIIDRTVARLRDQYDIGIPENSDFLEPIAIVAESHGSKFFEADIEELRLRDLRPGNEPARLRGIAALLLMGDELDLHRNRVDSAWPKDLLELSAVGQLHFHAHHYISRVDITRGLPSALRCIAIHFTFPARSAAYGAEMKEWLARRLLRQIRRTNPVLAEEFDGHFLWQERLSLTEETVVGPQIRDLPGQAARRLALEVTDERLLDRVAIRAEISAGLAGRGSGVAIVGLRVPPGCDGPYILRWVLALSWAQPVVPVELDFSLLAGHDALDLPEAVRDVLAEHADVLHQLAEEKPPHLFDLSSVREARDPDLLLDALVQAASAGDIVLILKHMSKASARVKTWCAHLLDRVAESGRGFALALDQSALTLPQVAVKHTLNAFREKHIAKHLEEGLGYPAEDAQAEARSIFQLSNGHPERVLLNMLTRVSNAVEPRL